MGPCCLNSTGFTICNGGGSGFSFGFSQKDLKKDLEVMIEKDSHLLKKSGE